jgi:hypothetical protein
MGGVRSFMPSLASAGSGALAGGAVGTAIGGPVGTVAGGIVGAGLGALGLFGAGVYGKEKDAYLEKNPDDTLGAHRYALGQAAIEGGIEAVATPIEILTGLATGGTGKTLTQPVKQTVKQLLRVGPKQIAKNYAKTIGIETGTEMLQSGLGNEWAKKYGMAEGATQEAILESIIPAVTMSLLFGTGVQGYNLNERRKIKNAIESGEADPTQRAEAADFVHRELLKDDAELAEAWKNYSQAAIDSGQDIDIDEDFANYASAKIEAEKTGAGPIQKAADQAPPVGIDAIPSMGEVPEFTDNTETDIDRERLGATSVAAVREEHGEKVAAQVRKAKANGESITIEEAKKRAEPPKIDKKQERKDLGITRPQQRLLDLLRAKGKPSRLLDVKMDEPNQKAMNGLIQKGLVQRNENGTYEIGGTVDTSASEQRDLMYQFAETAQDVQDQADARTRAYRFEQMPGELEWQRQEQAAREYNQGKNVKRSEDAHLFPAFDKMVEEMKGGYVSRSAQNQYGETSPTVSANPDWIKQRTVKEYNKRTGSDISISKEDVQTIFNKVKNNRPLTNRQQKQYDYLRSVAEKKINSDTELVRDNEFSNIEKKGFTLQEPETIAVGDLQKGEEIVVVDDKGIPDVLTNKGRDKDGDIILQDGITMRVDEFDTVDVIGRRMTDKAKFENQQRQAASQEVPEGETQAQPAPAKSAPIIEEKPTDDAKPADTGEQSSKTVSQPVQTEQTAQNEQPSDLPSVGTEPSSKAAPATPPPKAEGWQRSESSSSSKIDDFGEKIGGAKKDVWASFKDKMGEVPDADIASEPLSKIWPKPDYQAMIDGGMDKGVVALARALRDAIPNKPRKRVARWAELVKGLRDIATSVVGQTVSVAETRKLIRESKNADIGAILDQADLYLEVGHGKSLAGIRVSAGQYSMLNGVEYNPAKTIWTVEQQAKKTAFSSWPRILAQGNTKEDAIADFKKKYEQLEINKPAERQVTFDIYSYRDKGKPGFYVGKKIGRNHIDIAGPFDTVKEARQYKNDNHDTLIDRLNKFKEIPRERRDTNEPRVGEDMRGGEDVTPEMFSEAFGFRGVEFGNWVEQKKRQEDLNNAYDSLMDMAAVIGINPNAISLNGQLGLAFGARGSGGKDAAAAHYEPGKMVINLTKKSGAGSLGHEWWHAVDNYFARMRKGHDGSYMTDALDVSLSAKGSPYQHKGEVRKEMVDAFGAVMRAIRGTAMKARATVLDRKRTEQYWTTKTEMSARAFESYLISKLHDQGASNDYLANIVDEKTWKAAESLGFELDDSYPYPTAGEIPAIRGAFDHFFSTIESRETDTGIELYAPEAQPRTVWTENFPDAVLMAEYGAAQKHPDYRAAKENGDIGAAFRLVKSLISRSGINKIKSIVSKGNATIVTPVISEERHGKNMIPRAYADILADEIGATADVDIIHINKVGRGGADGFHRLAAQPIFSGPVVSGHEYIIVDDSLAQGGTLASLKGYIESNGGKVVLFTALTGKQYSARIVPKRETLSALRKKYPALEEYWNKEFGYDFSRLTQSEARYILKLKGQDANSIRDRISTLRESQGAPENESPDSKGQGAVTGRTTLGALLKTAKRSRTITGKLAQLMSDFIPASKLDIPVIINPKAKSFSYNPQTNTITVRNPEQYSTSLHEIVHAVTVRELNSGTREAREALRKIKALMRNVAPELVKRNLISAELLSQVRDAKTSQAFKQMYPDSATNQYAYALLNEYEFLAQAFSSKEVQSVLKDIKVERNGALVRAWDAFIDTVMRVLGIEATHKDAFGEVVSIVAELSQMGAGKAAGMESVSSFAVDDTVPLSAAMQRIQNLPAFKRWFGDSKVVDENGEPLVVYHGTASDFTVFNVGLSGSVKYSDWGNGIYFTPSKWQADGYSEDARKDSDTTANKLWDEYEEKARGFGTTPMNAAIDLGYGSEKYKELQEYYNRWSQRRREIEKQPNKVVSAYLSISNPYLYTATSMTDPGLSDRAKSRGHDGIIISREDGSIDEIVAFSPAQIKSIYNPGKWSPTNPDIMEAPEEAAQDVYEQNRNVNRNIKARAIRGVKKFAKDIVGGIDKYLGASSTRLRNVSRKIEAKVRRLDFQTNTRLQKDTKAVLPLLQKAQRGMDKNDFADWDYARKNGDKRKIDELIRKYNLAGEYREYRDVLNRIRDEANHVGMDVGFIHEYAPRVLKDPQGFLNHLGRGDDWPVISERLKEYARKHDMQVEEMDAALKADIISNMLFGAGGYIGTPGNVKERKLKDIPAELVQYYMDSDAALMHYLYNMRKHIEIRNFFGKIPKVIAGVRSNMRAAQTRLWAERRRRNPDQEKIDRYTENIREYQDILDKYRDERDYTEHIGAYVMELIENQEIDPDGEKTVVDVLRARFHEVGSRGLVQAYKSLSYIDTMGSPISALTQIGDMAWTVFENGWVPSLRAAARSIVGKSRITREDVGIDNIAQEFSDANSLSKAVSLVFKAVGLEKIDSIGKESMLNAALEKYQKRSHRDIARLRDELLPIFEMETESVISDLQDGDITDNVKLLVYSKLLDYQPVGLSEMPEMYLMAGNGRIFYMLKTFTIKQFDVYRRQIYHKVKNGTRKEKIEGIRNMVYLSMLFVLANGGADELKDWVLGRKTTFSDRLTDNVLRLFGVSKYITWQARTEGLGTAVAKQILPPFKFINSAYKDVATAGDGKGLYTTQSVPVLGKLAYWHMGRGKDNQRDIWEARFSQEKRRLNKIKDKVDRDGTLARKYAYELRRLKLINKIQADLNKKQSRINKLEDLERSGVDYSATKKKLQQYRIMKMKQFLEQTRK